MRTGDLASRSLEDLEDEVATLAARVAAETGRLLLLLAELARREAWAGQGFRSLAHWLAWRTGLDLGAAREHVRVALALVELPRTAELLARGRISYSKARAITRVARPETEEALLEMALDGTAAQLERIVRGVRRADREGDARRAETLEARRGLHVHFDDDGMLVLSARLAPEEGALLLRALESARAELWTNADKSPRPDADQERADALALVADRSLAAGGTGRCGADRTQVVVHVDAEVLDDPAKDGRSHLDDGPSVPAEMSRRLACDASVVEMTHGQDGQVAAGRKTRRISAALRRALHDRDGGRCQFPGCGARVVDVHHLRHWADGGPTTLSNTLSLCRLHHVRVHEGGFRVELGPAGPRFFRPDGRPVPAAPPAPPLDERPPAPSDVGPWTLAPTWTGEPVDYGWAVASLVRLGQAGD